MTILLDIDGVLVTTPIWRTVELHEGGFLMFNERAAKNLARLIDQTHSSITLTTTHRITYSIEQWKLLLQTRGIFPYSISKINETRVLSAMPDRATEILEWVEQKGSIEKFIIIDDDLSINRLPISIKEKWILTKPMIGLDDEATDKALSILLSE